MGRARPQAGSTAARLDEALDPVEHTVQAEPEVGLGLRVVVEDARVERAVKRRIALAVEESPTESR
jgi:hypothetical protein